jgi:hypothetical protein
MGKGNLVYVRHFTVCNILDFVETVFHLDVSLHNAPQGKRTRITSHPPPQKMRKSYYIFYLF